MSELKQPLVQAPKSVPQDPLSKPQEPTKRQILRGEMQSLRESLSKVFTPAEVCFSSKYQMVLFSKKHNHLIALNSNDSVLEIKSLDPKVPAVKKPLGFDNEIYEIKLNKKEDLLYVGVDDGFYIYNYPEIDINKKRSVIIGDDGYQVLFDVNNDDAIFAAYDGGSIIYQIELIDQSDQSEKSEEKDEEKNEEKSEEKSEEEGEKEDDQESGEDKGESEGEKSEKDDRKNFKKTQVAKAKEIYSLKSSNNGRFLAVADDQAILIYSRRFKWVQFEYKIKIQDDPEKRVERYEMKIDIEFFSDNKRVAILVNQTIETWNIYKGEIEKTFKLQGDLKITALKISSDDDYLICQDNNLGLTIWNTQNDQAPRFVNKLSKETLKKHKKEEEEDNEYGLWLDEESNLIYTFKRNLSSVFTWKSNMVYREVIEVPSEPIREVVCSSDGRVFVLHESKIMIRNDSKETFNIDLEDDEYRFMCLDDSPNFCLYVAKPEKVRVITSFNLSINQDTDTYVLVTKEISCMTAFQGSLVLGFTDGSLGVRSPGSDNINFLINGTGTAEKSITVVRFGSNYLFAGDSKGTISVFVYPLWTPLLIPAKHKEKIKTLTFIKSSNVLISTADDKKCIFWSIPDQIDIKTRDIQHDVLSCIIDPSERNCILGTSEGYLLIYNLPGFDKVSEYRCKPLKNIKVLSDPPGDTLYIFDDKKTLNKMRSPFSLNIVSIISESIHIPRFIDFINSRFSKEVLENQDNWVITPSTINSLHIYAYKNMSKNLKKAMINNAKYYNSSQGYPIHISTNLSNAESTAVVLTQLRRRIKEDPYAFEHLSDILIELNKGGYKGLDELYYEFLLKSQDKNLVNTCNETVSLPIVKYALSFDIKTDEYFVQNPQDSKRVCFLYSPVRMNLEPGSQESKDFLDSILNCSNDEIFKTKFIRTVLEDKWNRVKWIMISNNLLFLSYLVFFCGYLMFKSNLCLWLTLFVNIILFIYELFQMGLGLLDYLSDVWNYVDLVRSALFFIYFYFACFSDPLDVFWMIVVITFLSWVRGITIFALFANTRYMISLLESSLKDIVSFAIIVMYSVVAFAFIKLSLDVYNSGSLTETVSFESFKTITHLIFLSYFDAIGQFETERESIAEQALVISNTIFNVIIMMNLLISILGNTYSVVNENAEVEDLKQLTKLILESEHVYFWKTGSGKKTVIQVCEEDNAGVVVQTPLKDKIKAVKIELIGLAKKNQELSESAKNIQSALSEFPGKFDHLKQFLTNEIKSSTDIIKGEIKATQIKVEEAQDKERAECLFGHELKRKDAEEYICDLCEKTIEKECLMCDICIFNICLDCESVLFNEKNVKQKLRCVRDHKMIYFTSFSDITNHYNLEPQRCRDCNNRIDEKGAYCVSCMYGICEYCYLTLERFFNKDEKKIEEKCSNKHPLHWRDSSLYKGKSSYVIECKKCKNIAEKAKVGAGFFTCNECSEHHCLECFRESYMKEMVAFERKEAREDQNFFEDYEGEESDDNSGSGSGSEEIGVEDSEDYED